LKEGVGMKKPRTRMFLHGGVRYRLKNCVMKKALTRREIWSVYKQYKKKNELLKRVGDGERGDNLNESISESLVCLHDRRAKRIKRCTANKKGDLFISKRRVMGEVKGSTGKGPSSFSPKSLAEVFYFVLVDTLCDTYKIYEFSREEVCKASVNKKSTVGETWRANKKRKAKVRPRFDFNKYIEENASRPTYEGSLRPAKKVSKVGE
jgi:hypothetical protein